MNIRNVVPPLPSQTATDAAVARIVARRKAKRNRAAVASAVVAVIAFAGFELAPLTVVAVPCLLIAVAAVCNLSELLSN